MKPILVFLMVASLLATAIPLSSRAVAQSDSSLSDYAPASALVYGEVELDQSSDQMILAKELLERANLQALLPEEQQGLLDEGIEVAEVALDGQAAFFLNEFAEGEASIDRLTGQAADIAVDPTTATQDLPSGWAVILRPNEIEATFEFLLGELENTVSDGFFEEASPTTDVPVAVETYEGYEIHSRPGDEWNSPMAVAMVDEVVVAASVPEDVQVVIDVATGDAAPISDVAEYQTIRDQLPGQAIAHGYVDGPSILEAIESDNPEDLAEVPDDLIESLQAYQGFAVWADAAGFRVDSVALPAPGVELDEVALYTPEFPGLVPGTSLTFTGGMNLGQQPALDLVALEIAQEIVGISPDEIATPADPEAYAEEIFAEAAEVIGFNLKTDLLDNLDGEWGAAVQIDSIFVEGPEFAAIFMTEVSDPEAVAAITDAITEQAEIGSGTDFELSSREVAGSEVTVIDGSDEEFPITIEFGVVDGMLVVGVNGWLDLVDVPPTASLADDSTFQETLAALPGDMTSISYVNLQQVLPLVDEAIGLFFGSSFLDNDPACAEFATQEEAQTALDDDPFENYFLDLDWDGEACEDHFSPPPPVDETAGIADVNVLSFGVATWADGDARGSSSILLIGD